MIAIYDNGIASYTLREALLLIIICARAVGRAGGRAGGWTGGPAGGRPDGRANKPAAREAAMYLVGNNDLM